MPSRRRKPLSVSECAWCGTRKPLSEMRHPLSSRGKTPSTCHACRESHPHLGWCDFHGGPHPRSAFPVTNRPIGILNICNDAVAYKAAAERDAPPRRCPACLEERESWFFRGGRMKRAICRDCEDSHPGESWCVDCAAWLPVSAFYRTGRNGKFLTTRCKTCRSVSTHGVTLRLMADLTGGPPACGACGSTADLKVDHDHDHCPAQRGCQECVRGWLCHSCNTAEGLLGSPERARLLATYMERVSRERLGSAR